MPKKKAKPEPPAEEDHPGVEGDPKVVFDAWLKTCTEAQRKTILEVYTTLLEIQSTKKDLRRELQPLRVGMELSKVKQVIVGRSGKANPQQETGRIWGAYRDSHLKAAGYSKSSCDAYVAMIEEARVILPSDELILTLLNHTDEKGAVVMSGGNRERPFGKFTMYLKSDDVQQHVKDGKVNLDDLTEDDLIANVFDSKNIETPDRPLNLTVAVNTVMKRILSELKGDENLPKDVFRPVVDEAKVIKHSHPLVKYVIEVLLAACNMEPVAFEPMSALVLEADEIITLSAMVKAANDDKKKKADSKPEKKNQKASKKSHLRGEQPAQAEPEIRPEGGKYVIRKSPKPKFPMTPWEIFEDGKDNAVARCQDKLQAAEAVTGLLKKAVAAVDSPNPHAASAQDKVIRKHLEANKPPLAAG
jgi:hypothetical protein